MNGVSKRFDFSTLDRLHRSERASLQQQRQQLRNHAGLSVLNPPSLWQIRRQNNQFLATRPRNQKPANLKPVGKAEVLSSGESIVLFALFALRKTDMIMCIIWIIIII
jgi:hypothetical protein